MRDFNRRDALGLLAVTLGCRRLRRAGDLALGVVAPRTGDRGVWGEDLVRGVELAAALQNVRGGVNGRPVRVVALDDESRDERAAGVAARLIDHEGPAAVLGELSSHANDRAAQVAQRRGVVFVATASTARDLSRVGDMVFRTALTDGEQAGAIARFARQSLRRRRAAIVYRRSSLLHVGMADAFAAAFRAEGGELVPRESYTDDAELVRVVARVRSSGADAVYAPGDSADAGRIAVAARQGRMSAQVLGNDGWSSPEVRRYAGDAVVGVHFTDAFTVLAARPEVEAFVAAFRERFRATPGTFAALGYDAARWVLKACARLPQPEGRALRDAMINTRLEDGVAGAFAVDASRALQRSIQVLRYEREGVTPVAYATP